MAEFKFTCSSCNQSIICDELWSGHQIQCPSCQVELVVPPKPTPAPGSSLVPPPPPQGSAPKLSIGRSQQQSEAAVPKSIPGVKPPPRPPARKGNPLLKIAKIGAIVIVLGVGGFFGYSWLSDMQEKSNAKRRQAEKNSDGGEVGHIANLYNVLDATDPDKRGASGRSSSGPNQSRIANSTTVAVPAAGSAAQAATVDKQLPIVAPVWTLDVASAKIPEGQLTGKVAGTNFNADSIRLDRVSGAQVLSLRQGLSPSPDRELLLYLHLNPGETLAGHSWTVSQDMTGPAAPRVLKRWKTDPRFAPQQKFFSTGYALKLELGQPTDGVMPAKIFLALPDTEQSVVGGLFKIPPATPEVTAQPLAQPIAQPAPVQAPTGPADANRAAFDKRYGVRR